MPAKITPSNGQLYLSPNFTLSEMIESDTAERHGLSNTPNSPTVMANLGKLAALLERVRAALGKPVVVSSAYRGPEVNRLVGGSTSSEHMIGAAADIKVPGFGAPLAVARAILAAKIPFGQLIWEGSWVHISLPDGINDGEVLTARFVMQPNGKTKAVYTKGLPQ